MDSKMLIKEYGVPLISVICISSFSSWFLFCANAEETVFSEVLVPLLLFIGLGVVLYIAFSLISRDAGKSALAAGIIMFMFTNFSLVENLVKVLFPNLKYWHTLPIIQNDRGFQ